MTATELLASKLSGASKQHPKSEFDIRAEMNIRTVEEFNALIRKTQDEGCPVMKARDTNAWYIGDERDRDRLARQRLIKAYNSIMGAQKLMGVPQEDQITMTEIEKIARIEE